MYQALYRKYRPSTFEEVVGQDIIVRTLKNAIKNNKLSHAYLFTGPRGTGKTSIAKLFGKVVNCENLNSLDPCNVCVSCTQINQKQTTDIIEIDAASNNGVDEIRELKSKVNLVPTNSKYKIYIIDEVHMLTTGAFNALLKTLEEPPAHVIFILATTEPHKIPLTILSRCQRFDFKKISEKDIAFKLNKIVKLEDIKISEEGVFEIARLSDGGMRDALSMLDQLVSYADDVINMSDIHELNGTLVKEELAAILKSYLSGNIKDVFEKLEDYNSKGKDFVKLTEEMVKFLKDVLISVHVENYFSLDDHNIYQKVYIETDQGTILKMIDNFNSSLNSMKSSNSPKTILEIAFIKTLNREEKNEQLKQSKKDIEIKAEKKIVENEKITIPVTKIDNQKKSQLIKVKELRINNALATFSKPELNKIRKDIEEIRSYILDHDYSKYASMILDGTIGAYGSNYVVYIYDTEETSDYFNENILKIEELMKKCLAQEYKVISTYNNNWEEVKKQFNSKKVKYELKEEDYDLKELLKNKNNKKDEIQNMFEDIIEYK